MADVAGSSSSPAGNDKPVIVRVKRKAVYSRLDGFWLEINDRPVKRPLIDFDKLSISKSQPRVEEVKTKKVFVQHIETLGNSEVEVDVLQSVLPDSSNTADYVSKSEERRHTYKTESKQDQLRVKAKKEHEVSSRNARFEQVWRKRRGIEEANRDEVLQDMCQFYDVVRVDDPETANKDKELNIAEMEDYRLMSWFLPLLKDTVPAAASEIESEFDNYIRKGAAIDDYVYDLYAVKSDTPMMPEDDMNPFPLVKVEVNDDEFYNGPDESESGSFDSNAEDNPMNDYPDEDTSSNGKKTQSEASDDISEEDEKSVSSVESLQHEKSEQDAFIDDEFGHNDYYSDNDHDTDNGCSDDQCDYP